jgi:hypothetical protein
MVCRVNAVGSNIRTATSDDDDDDDDDDDKFVC